jgi:RNA polymerase sigma-70 factor (ECF subfamily)
MSAEPPEEREGTTSVPTSAADLGPTLERLRPRLERMVTVRLDPRLRRRVDEEDVLQEAFAEVARRLSEFHERRPMPFFLWVRLLTGQKLAEFHRRHLGAAQRDAGREVTPGNIPSASTVSLARAFVDPGRSPAHRAASREVLARIQAGLERLEVLDREMLALRYFEGLTNDEAALVLGLSSSSAKRRHVQALRHLRAELPRADDVPTP